MIAWLKILLRWVQNKWQKGAELTNWQTDVNVTDWYTYKNVKFGQVLNSENPKLLLLLWMFNINLDYHHPDNGTLLYAIPNNALQVWQGYIHIVAWPLIPYCLISLVNKCTQSCTVSWAPPVHNIQSPYWCFRFSFMSWVIPHEVNQGSRRFSSNFDKMLRRVPNEDIPRFSSISPPVLILMGGGGAKKVGVAPRLAFFHF